MITHFWLDSSAADLLANPEKWCVKMEINNPSGTPLARYIRLGAAESEDAGKFYMWDPASSNNGVALNTMGEWQTVQLEVTDLFPPLEENGQKTCLKIATDPYNNTDRHGVLPLEHPFREEDRNQIAKPGRSAANACAPVFPIP